RSRPDWCDGARRCQEHRRGHSQAWRREGGGGARDADGRLEAGFAIAAMIVAGDARLFLGMIGAEATAVVIEVASAGKQSCDGAQPAIDKKADRNGDPQMRVVGTLKADEAED